MQLIARVNRGGTATWLDNLVSGLRENGIETLLAAGYCPENEIEDECFSKLNGIRIENLGRNISIFSDVRAFFEIRKLIKTFRPDVLNTHTAKAGALGRIAVFTILIDKPKVIHTYHGHVLTGYFNTITSKIFKFIEIALANITDLIIVSGHKVQSDLLEMGIGNYSKFRYISPGIKLLKKYEKRQIREEFSVENSAICIGWIGRLTQIKRPEIFIKLAANFPENLFLIAGEGELRGYLEKNSPHNLKFLGWQDAAKFLSICDILVLTSENEGKPLALVEAAQFGLPVIADDVGAVSEVVLDGVSGYLTHNQSERLKFLQILISNPELRKEMGKAASNFANEEFSQLKFIKNHLTCYEEVLNK